MSSRRPGRLLALSTAAALIAGALASTPVAASAATGTFAQPAPITANHTEDDYVWDDADAGFAVPDAGGASSSVSLTAPANATTTWVGAWVRVTHESQDDLDLVLVAPNGKATTLASDIGGANAVNGWLNFESYYDSFSDDGGCATGCSGAPTDFDSSAGDTDAFAAPTSFTALGGSPAAGTWTLHAYDDTTGGTGTVDSWGVGVYYGLPASPSPSTLEVTGLPKGVTDVNLTLNDVTGYIGDTEFMLESPDGRRAHVLSDAANDDALAAVDLTLDDEAALPIPRYDTPTSGSYRPRNLDDDDQSEPIGGVETVDMDARMSVFDGGSANGTWKLWVFQEWSTDAVDIAGWSLQISTGDAPAAPVVTSPKSGAFLTDDTVTLTGTAAAGAVVRVTEGGKTQSTVADGGSWSLTKSGLAEGSHTFAVTQSDAAGNTSPAVSVTVVVDTKAPRVGKTNPKDGAKGVKRSLSPTVKFSEAMNAKSLKKAVKLATSGGKSVDVKLKWNAKKKKLTVNPKKDLAGHTGYVLTVKKKARDLAGNRLAKGKTVGFTTG